MLGLFSKERALKRAMDKVVNKHAQSADRYAAMEKLRDAGTDDALYALCRRFSFTYDKTIEDEQEKQWVRDVLIAKGEAAVPAVRRYLKSADSVAQPLMVLERIAGKDQALEIIDELLADEPPGYVRDATRRIQILDWLAEYRPASDEEVCRRVIPYLADFDENSRFAAINAVAHRPHESAYQPLVAALVNPEEESKRLKIRIAEVLADAGVPLGDHKKEVSELLETELAGFRMKHDRLERKG